MDETKAIHSLLMNGDNETFFDKLGLSFSLLDDTNNETKPIFPFGNLVDFICGLGHIFYLIQPGQHRYQHVEQVPLIFQQAWPYFLTLIIIENVILWIEKRPLVRLNDTIASFSHGLLQECTRLLFRGTESLIYIYVYNNYRLVDLQWDSPITWYLAAIGVDFCYYWLHRASHEVHILWAQHQVHHSSEDFNLSVGLRQSFLQRSLGSFFYLPLAFFIPPSLYLTHQQFNLLFQFWIHTEAVKTLGPLEWIFNTPKHHRVHHGSNLYCLDTNYGGVLIIWDRLFGTFAEEKPEIDLIYGLVMNQPSFNPFFLQTFYTAYVIDKFKEMKTWRYKLAALFYGPSWLPGAPRLGREEDKINVQPREKFDVQVPLWCNIYLICHFVAIVYGFQELAAKHLALDPFLVVLFIIYILISLTSIGMLFEDNRLAGQFEFVRCIVMTATLWIHRGLLNSPLIENYMKMFFTFSSLFWLVQISTNHKQAGGLMNREPKEKNV